MFSLIPRSLLVSLLILFSASVLAENNPTLKLKPVAESIYAIVGELGNRSADNLGNNATFGLVITGEGAVLIDSGATLAGARAIHQVIQSVTDQPVVKVINTGGQDHRWLGNDYFRSLGAEIIASEAAVADHKTRATDQLFGLSNLVGPAEVEETDPAFADKQFKQSMTFRLGNIEFVIQHHGAAHTPGDSFVWLPSRSVVFTGDIVYVERMLGVIDVSSSRNWLEAFQIMADLDPQVIVPGHGSPTDLQQATQDTYDYLNALRQAVAEFIDEGNDIADIGLIDHSAFSYLRNYDQLAGRNAQQVFTEMEWE